MKKATIGTRGRAPPTLVMCKHGSRTDAHHNPHATQRRQIVKICARRNAHVSRSSRHGRMFEKSQNYTFRGLRGAQPHLA